jgi:hypothetical protein
MTRKLSDNQARKIMLEAKLKPLEPYKSAWVNWKCKCLSCGEICHPKYGNIKNRGGGCPSCSKIKRGLSRRISNSVAESYMLKAGFKPLAPYKTAHSEWKCRCLVCKRIISTTYWTVKTSNSTKKGCATCKGVKVDLKIVLEKMKAAKLKPLEPYQTNSYLWRCKHLDCGRIVYVPYKEIQAGQGGCGICRYKKAGDKLRIPQSIAKRKMLDAGLKTLELYINKDTPWKSRCLTCKNITYPTYGNVVMRGQGGCSFCRETGLNYRDPAYIYLIFHKHLDSIKIGVSNVDSRPNRLKSHQKEGWSVYKTKNYKTGFNAEKVETGILRWLRKDLLLGHHLTSDFMPQGGHSETVDASEIDLPTIWAKVEELSVKQKLS